ncbi:MAG: nucleoside triphosphate pyrophosphohydrolase [Chthoniobacterales bacterium]
MTGTITHLREIVAQLRSPDGCPWDKEQTSASLIPSFIEEVYEVIDTIDRQDQNHLREELGDILLHVIFQADIASDAGHFNFDDVLAEICEKLIRRHPHVFGAEKMTDTAAVLKQWDEIKLAEKGGVAKKKSLLSDVPMSFPALLRAAKLQHKAAKVGFDWPDAEPVFAKINEEIAEVREAVAGNDATRIEDELGDVLFSVVNLARKLKIDPELALQRASNKFTSRFSQVETLAESRQLDLQSLTLEQLDALWDEAKISS